MTREKDLIAAFTVAIRELGVSELKKTSMFARVKMRSAEIEELPEAA